SARPGELRILPQGALHPEGGPRLPEERLAAPCAAGGVMIAVIFEVVPAPGRMDLYLDTARDLRRLLDGIEGFISIERFRSLTDPTRLLSLSFWRDEAAVKAWRTTEEHRAAQSLGRGGVFDAYRLRIASVVRDYGLNDRNEAPEDSRAFHAA